MPAAVDGKACTKCGVFKEPSEFYVNRRLKSGGVILVSKCKACKRRQNADHKRNRNGGMREYRTMDEIQASKKPPPAMKTKLCDCGTSIGQRYNMCPKCKADHWTRLAHRQTSKLRKVIDLWKARANAATVSLRSRAPMPKKSLSKQRSSMSWDQAIRTASKSLEKATNPDPWRDRVSNARRMLARRSKHRLQRASN